MKTPRYMRQKLPMVLVVGLGGFFNVVDVACAQPWATTTAPNLSWKALASSADGTKLVAAADTRGLGGYFSAPPAPIYVSTNAGATWIQTSTPSNNWSSVASSADGVRLVAVAAPWWDRGLTNYVSEGAIYTSLDSGATWSRTAAPTNYWTSVASSADGARLVAVSAPTWDWNLKNYVGDGTVYRSLDSGASWSRTSAPTNNWISVASSADGNKLVVVAALCWYSYGWGYGGYDGDGRIYTSSDSGATWTPTSAPTNTWSSVASSVDGTKLVAAASTGSYCGGDGLIYTSSNSGLTWTLTSAPKYYWSAVASSADGTKLVASTDSEYGGGGLIYASTNTGVTWTATGAPGARWTAVASSADGYRVVAAGGPIGFGGLGPLCTLPDSGPWRLADAPVNVWNSVASSADGTKLVAAASSYSSYGGVGLIYTSGNSGVTWTPTSAPTNYWTSVASSADGARLVAVAARNQFWNGTKDDYVGDGAIYRSLDSGATWTRTSAPSNCWSSVASSANSAKLVAAAAIQQVWNGTNYDYFGNGTIHRSLDSGATWSRTSAPTNSWTSVASSADGARLVAVAAAFGVRDTNGNWNWVRNGAIYSSPDSGANWTQTSAPTNSWASVASSADGTKLVAAAWEGTYTSSDSGTTWVPTSGPSNYWWRVASSADGTNLVALGGVDAGEIYVSTNAGVTWTPAGPLPAANEWSAVASSADGSNIVAVGANAICLLRAPAPVPPLPPSPQLVVGLSGATLGLSWLVPSTRFVLQEDSELGSTNWVEVPTPPTLDLTNLHQRLTLTPSLGSSFYRLKQQ